jgi:hypothetical protein
VGIDERLGWWMAPDGNWYPPELQPARQDGGRGEGTAVMSARIRPMGPRSRFECLQFGGTCVNCGARIRPRDEGWNDPDIRQLMCADCWPAVVASHPSAMTRPSGGRGEKVLPPDGGEASAPTEAMGEYLMDIRLHRDLGDGAVVLSNRRVPHSPATVDNVVVAPSGVWIVDAMKLDGLIEYRAAASPRADLADGSGECGEDGRLLVGGHDRTALIDRAYDYVIPVANLVADPCVPIHGVIAIVEGNWGNPTRLLTRRPYQHQGIWILWPAALIKKIEEPGPLGHDDVLAIGATLDRALPPR